MDRELPDFARRINAEIHDELISGEGTDGDAYSELVFTEYVTEHLASIGVVDQPQSCHFDGLFGRTFAKINGYALNDDEDRLDLFVTIFLDAAEPRPVPREDVTKAAERAVRFFEGARKGMHEKLEPAGEAYAFARRVNELGSSITRVRVFVLTDGLASTKKLDAEDVGGTEVKFEIWDIERLHRGMLSGVPRDEIEVDFPSLWGSTIPCLPAPDEGGDYRAYLALLPGEMLYRLYDEYGPRLLELNVRSFLGVRGSKTVNSGIRATLKDQPNRFAAYNNGIVVTADKLEVDELPEGGHAIRAARGLQIVNGGQTTASIHRARKVDHTDLSSVLVPAKIITVTDPAKLDEIVQKISRYANSQNVVQPADFSANHPYHVKLEEFSNTVWCPDGQSRWFYERARGSYQDALSREGSTPAAARRFRERTAPQRRFTKPELAKYLNAWDQKPHLVSLGGQKNFDIFMQSLMAGRNSDWLPDEVYYKQLIAKAILFRAAQRIVRGEKFPAYQANITTYLISYLAWCTSQSLDLDGIWTAQKVSPQLCELLRKWSHDIDQCLRETAQGKMVSEWAKREPCWDAVRDLQLPLPDPLPPEMAGRKVVATSAGTARRDPYQEKLGAEDYRNIDICKQVDGPTWLRIHAWGTKSGQLHWKQCGIAQSLAGYAAAGWLRGPSPKQARAGVGILNKARAAGFFDDGSTSEVATAS